MHTVDGSDGGGQLVRSTLTLSMVRGEPVEITGVRGARDTPGLRPQHLAAVEVAAEITNATVEGATEGSSEVIFDPGAIEPGTYEVAVGTAGSTTLLLDTFLPLAATIDEPLQITAEGGTDVKWSPPLDYHQEVKFPLLRAQGWGISLDSARRGFYPAGGGTVTLSLLPADPAPFDLADPQPIETISVYSVASADLAEADVATRKEEAVVEGLPEDEIILRGRSYGTTDCPGSVVVVVGANEDGPVAGASALGEPGRPAEAVADSAIEHFETIRESGGAVDSHLADQLLVPMAIAGGSVTIPERTDHVTTSCDLLEQFGYSISEEETEGGITITIES